MDMSNVKSIFNNSVGKEVKKITDANGNIMWYKIPDGYRKVEYIHGDGEQYINTGYSANANIEMTFKYKSDLIAPYSGSTTRCIIGGRRNVQNGISLWERDGNYQYGFGSTRFPAIVDAIQNTDIHTVKIAKGGDLWVDGTKIVTYPTSSGKSFPTGSYIYLFTCISSGVNTRPTDFTDKRTMVGRFYNCIIKDNDVIVRHLIPVVRNTDNKPGMYDLVNDVFYTNAGTGDFTWGEISNG